MTPSQEEWRPVLGYEGYYEVSDHGRVRSLDRVVDKGARGRPLVRGRVLRQRTDNQGRLWMTLARERRNKPVRVSVLVLEAFVGPRPEGLVACHNNGDPADNSLGNLRWDSLTANNYDAVRHGTHTNASKTHCPRGHRLAEPNVPPYAVKLGARTCRACGRASADRQRAARRGLPFTPEDFLAASHEHYARIMRRVTVRTEHR